MENEQVAWIWSTEQLMLFQIKKEEGGLSNIKNYKCSLQCLFAFFALNWAATARSKLCLK